MKLKITVTIAFLSTIPFLLISSKYNSEFNRKNYLSCTIDFTAYVSNKNNTTLDGVRKIMFFYNKTLQLSSIIDINRNGKEYNYSRDLVYKIDSYDSVSGVMKLNLSENITHVGDNTPEEIAKHFYLDSTSIDSAQYITVKLISNKYLWFGDLYSDAGLCLINKD